MELQKHAFNFALFISPALSKCPRCSTCPSWPFIQLPLYQLLDTSLQFTETTRIFIYFHCWNCRFLLSVKLPQKSELEIGQAKLQQWVRIEIKWEKVAKDQQGRSRQPTVKVALAGNLLESTKTQVPSHVCSIPVARVDKRTTSFWRDGHKVLPRNLGTFKGTQSPRSFGHLKCSDHQAVTSRDRTDEVSVRHHEDTTHANQTSCFSRQGLAFGQI